MVCGAALDGRGDDLPGCLLSLILQLGFHLFDLHSGLVTDFGFHAVQEVFLRLILGEARNLLQNFHLALLNEVDLILGGGDGGLLLCQVLFLPLIGVHFLIQGFFLLLQAAFLLLQVGPAALLFLLVFGAALQDFFLCLQQGLALFALGALDGLVDDAPGLLLRAGDLLF